MAADPASPSKRAKTRTAAKARRADKAAWRRSSFDCLAAGFTPEQIAEARKVSVSTVRREIDRAIAERRLDSPERYVHLQVARLTKALRAADAMIDRGDLKAVMAMVKLVAELDRYHGLKRQSTPPQRLPFRPAPESLPASSAPPLALSHSAPPLDHLAPRAAEVAGIDA